MENDNNRRNYANMVPDYSDPENYYLDNIDLRVGFGRRLAAYLIDIVTVSIINIGLYLLLQSFGLVDPITQNIFDASSTNQLEKIITIFAEQLTPYTIPAALLYYITEVFYGVTLGKLILEIKITDQNRTFASRQQLLTRYLVKHINTVFALLVLLTSLEFLNILGSFLGLIVFIGCFFVLGLRRQALHDMIAKTAVYYKDELDENYENY